MRGDDERNLEGLLEGPAVARHVGVGDASRLTRVRVEQEKRSRWGSRRRPRLNRCHPAGSGTRHRPSMIGCASWGAEAEPGHRLHDGGRRPPAGSRSMQFERI